MSRSIDDIHIDNPAFDPTDPHGHGHGHHGHHIISAGTLLTVLGLLLFFTFLTVAVSRGEVWVQDTFNVVLPQWVNVLFAMSIATIKALLVCAYFMGLRFDKALNSVIMLVCIVTVMTFLFFTAIDLGNRDSVSALRATVPVPGGTGYGANQTKDSSISTGVSPRPSTNGLPLVEFRRQERINEYALAIAAQHDRTEPNEDDIAQAKAKFWGKYYQKYVDEEKPPHRHNYDDENYFEALGFAHHDTGGVESVSRPHLDTVYSSSPNFSVGRKGLTPNLFSTDAHAGHAPADEGHAQPETQPDH